MTSTTTSPLLHAGFDAEIRLDDLFDDAERAQWEAWLSAQAQREVRIVEPDAFGWRAAVLYHELEPLLALTALPPAQLAPSLVAMFEAQVRERIRYRLASTLQTDASAHDYAALQASEARYRALAEELERRVQTQVAELARARLHAFQAEHLRAVAALAAGVAHEINNPLAFVTANLRSARGYLRDLQAAAASQAELLADFDALLDETGEGVARLAGIVGQLRVFSQVDAPLLAPACPRALAEAAAAVLAAEVPPGVALRIDGEARPFVCEAAALSQALLHLLRNALQSMDGRSGAVQLRLEESKGAVLLQVRDNGCGMAAEVLARACEPFFSTRPVGSGVGLGLAVAADVARRHGGRLLLQSQVGEGSCVTMMLPEPAEGTLP
jgi:signal transduction histidine kinase